MKGTLSIQQWLGEHYKLTFLDSFPGRLLFSCWWLISTERYLGLGWSWMLGGIPGGVGSSKGVGLPEGTRSLGLQVVRFAWILLCHQNQWSVKLQWKQEHWMKLRAGMQASIQFIVSNHEQYKCPLTTSAYMCTMWSMGYLSVSKCVSSNTTQQWYLQIWSYWQCTVQWESTPHLWRPPVRLTEGTKRNGDILYTHS